jgi:TolA-binding protein
MTPHNLVTALFLGLCVCLGASAQGSTTPVSEHAAVQPEATPAEPAHPAVNLPEATEAQPDEIGRSLLVLAKRMAERHDNDAAETAYTEVLGSPVSDEVTEAALIGYAEFLRSNGHDTRAAAIYEKFLSAYPASQQATMVLIDLGRTLRDMGAFNLSLARFYAVLNSTLAITPENIQRYRDLAQLAKFEIAETYYQQGDYASAGKFFGRIKLLDLPPADRARATFREAYAFLLDGKLEQAIPALRLFLENFPKSDSAQEARYLLCISLRRLGRTQEALTETLTLLRSAKASANNDNESWTYWQRRTGNQLANDFYEQGDFSSALTIYQTLAELRSAPAWRWPALYQIGLCYERLRQADRAAATYRDILAESAAAQKAGTTPNGPASEVRGMAEWRLGQIDWTGDVEKSVHNFKLQQQASTAKITNSVQ